MREDSFKGDYKTDGLIYADLVPELWNTLGTLERTGWVEGGVREPETVQEHTIALKHLAASLGVFQDAELDILLRMLEVHDWAEAMHGDEILLDHQIGYEERKRIKFAQEYKAMKSICDSLGREGARILQLWERFELSNDEIASFARQLDKYQAVEQALIYEKEQGIELFREFFDYSQKYIWHPALLARMRILNEEWLSLSHTR